MLSQLNPINIIEAHLKTLGAKQPNQIDAIDKNASAVFLFSGIPFAIYQFVTVFQGYYLPAETVGVIVSAAAIIAGLLLNLLVLVYTLVINQAEKLTDARRLFIDISRHTFYNISFTVFVSLVLVLVSLMCLANNAYLKITGNILTFYIGTLTALSLLMVLKKCHKLIDFYFSRA
ncbi:hypothetical protein [Rhodoferax sp. UBA5149]|uniref:hypothetical protein n=1 Tax=Rhodoferax sp. UBA5149 TaxID=1947379 RepID=UPI0025EA7361|nr:hypothetical protein [Rhodoferax sp. UBA5149]